MQSAGAVTVQLQLDLDAPDWGRFPNGEIMRAMGLGTAVFYYVCRERMRGHADPDLGRLGLTAEQDAYIEYFARR